MTADLEARIAADFPTAQRDEVRATLELLLDELGSEGHLRVIRCVLFLARGDLTRLVHSADRARMDLRDVIYWAEYDDQDRKVYDFSRPFPVL